MKIISRKQAIALGLNQYFTSKQCKYGHVSHRYTSSGGCIECQRLARNPTNHQKYYLYDQVYRLKNKERIRRRQHAYYLANQEKMKARSREQHRKQRLKYKIALRALRDLGVQL